MANLHVAIILDGNGRWAKQQNKPRTFGHNHGTKTLITLVQKWAKDNCNVNHLSLFCFSTENSSRPKQEVKFLHELFFKTITNKKVIDFLIKNKIKFNWIGFKNNISVQTLKAIKDLEQRTNKFKLNLNIFFNYGGIQDINQAAKQKNFSKSLLTSKLPDIDLLIRTSGEKRISNFTLMLLSYSELLFEDKFWPDYTYQDFKKNIAEFKLRKRRFGKKIK